MTIRGRKPTLWLVAAVVRKSRRDTDMACDFGQHGLVFGVVLPGTPLDRAEIVAGKLEAAVRAGLPSQSCQVENCLYRRSCR